VDGVLDTQVGYTGGRQENPTYRQVCAEGTGHAEAVEVTYDPARVPYEGLLRAFLACNPPGTTAGQYRSAIFYHTEAQRAAAEAFLKSKGVAIRLEPAARFWRAEEYHQRHDEKRRAAAGSR
jgi:peptide-methionine (S)-S-oxide reductase